MIKFIGKQGCAAISRRALVIAIASILFNSAFIHSQVPTKFDFGTGTAAAGYTKVTPTTTYSTALGYGFENGTVTAVSRGGADILRGDYCTGTSFDFSVTLPQGYYLVTLYLGDLNGTSATTVWGEQRRLFIDRFGTASGQIAVKTFAIARRAPKNATVTIIETLQESSYVDFDNKLTLNFTGAKPCVCGVEIVPIDTAITVFLGGNSTLVDQPGAAYGEWGQYFTKFFTSKVCIDNEAQSGETAHNFILEHRLDMIMSLMKPGDYFFMEFGTNDGKTDTATAKYIPSLQQMIDSTLAKKGIPIVVTPACRVNDVDSSKSIYGIPDTTRKYAKLLNAKIIDLNSMTLTLKKAVGANASKMYVSGDPTHFCNFGGFELARCMALGIINANLDLAKYLNTDLPVFNLSKPDPVDYLTTPSVAIAAPVPSEVRNAFPNGCGISVDLTTRVVRFSPGRSGAAMFAVYSLNGKQVAEKKASIAQTQESWAWPELSKLPAGIYVFNMNINNAVIGKEIACKL
jgi:lysophospholipase L1-like esterase